MLWATIKDLFYYLVSSPLQHQVKKIYVLHRISFVMGRWFQLVQLLKLSFATAIISLILKYTSAKELSVAQRTGFKPRHLPSAN